MGDWAGGLSNLFAAIELMVGEAIKMQGGLVPVGQKLFLVALTLTILNDVYQWWIKGDATELLARWVRLFVVASIPFSLLFADGAWIKANQTLVGFFQSGVTEALGASSSENLQGVIKGTLKSVVDAVSVDPPKSETGFELTKPSTWIDAAKDTFSSLGGLVVEFLLKIIVFMGVAAMTLGMLVAGYIPLVALQIGIIVGPILIAWLPFEPMANYAHTWLKFMIVNAMTIVVAVILLLMTKAAMGPISSTLAEMIGGGIWDGTVGMIASVFMIVAILLFVTFMLFQADEIAGGLIGHSSVGGGFMGRAVSGAMGKAVKQGAVGKGGKSGGGEGGKSGGGGGGSGGALGAAGRAAQTAVSSGGAALTSAGNTMGQKAVDMLNKGGTLGNKVGGSALAAAASVSYGTGHLVKTVAPHLGMSVGDAVSKAGNAASKASHASAEVAGKAVGGAGNVVAGAAQKSVDLATDKLKK